MLLPMAMAVVNQLVGSAQVRGAPDGTQHEQLARDTLRAGAAAWGRLRGQHRRARHGGGLSYHGGVPRLRHRRVPGSAADWLCAMVDGRPAHHRRVRTAHVALPVPVRLEDSPLCRALFEQPERDPGCTCLLGRHVGAGEARHDRGGLDWTAMDPARADRSWRLFPAGLVAAVPRAWRGA